MKDIKIRLPLLACDYMERTYGEKWEERLKLSTPAITNAFIDGYMTKENENKTVTKMVVNQKRIDIIGEKLGLSDFEKVAMVMEKVFGISVRVAKFVPEHLAALTDDKGNVLSFIEFERK